MYADFLTLQPVVDVKPKGSFPVNGSLTAILISVEHLTDFKFKNTVAHGVLLISSSRIELWFRCIQRELFMINRDKVS